MPDSPTPRTRVREVRKARRITQAELARACGVSRQTAISIEAGDYSPSVYLALKVAATLESRVEDLFYFEPQLSFDPQGDDST